MRATPKITVDTPIGADVDLEAEDVRTSTGRRLTDTVVDELVEAATEARGAVSYTHLTLPTNREV